MEEQNVVCRPKIAANSARALRDDSCPAAVAEAPTERAAPVKRMVEREEKRILMFFAFFRLLQRE